MAQFIYRAKDSTLNVVEGTIEADNESAAISTLGSRGVFPISLTMAHQANASSPWWISRQVSAQTLAYATRQLADLLGGGLPLLNALTLLAKQTEHRTLRAVVDALAAAVKDGRALSQALAEHPTIFPPLYISMVKAGEVTGALEQALARLADLGEHEAELRGRVINAAVYPMFVLLLALLMTLFLMTYVIPKLSLVFVESGQLLPLPTRMLLAISGVCTQWWWVLGIGVMALAWVVRRWSSSAAGKATLDRVFIAMPGFGTLVRKLETARLTRSLGVMVGQGVPVLQAIEVVASNTSNVVLRQAVNQLRDAVRDGSSIAAALTASGQFPAFVSNMVAIGEESGTVDTALMKVATAYEREADRAIRTLTTLLDPLLLVFVGGIVMFIVLAMLLPIFQMGLGAQ